MSSKKFISILSLLTILGLMLSACQPAATEEAQTTGGLMCVIVPPV